MAQAIQTNQKYVGKEVVVERPDGSRVTVLAQASPMHDDVNRLVGAVCVLVEISDRQRTDEARIPASTENKQFLATLVHELRNPLAPISNSLQILRLTENVAPAIVRVREIIEQQLQQLIRVVDRLSSIARDLPSNGDLPFENGNASGILDPVVEVSCPPTASAADSTTNSLIAPQPGRRILVVDDLPAACFVLGKLLETLGHTVRTAKDGETALQFVRAERPDVIFSDIGMPNMDGYQLAQQLRQEPELKSVVLVALTGYGEEGDKQRALAAGFDHHLVKPVSLSSLHELLEKLPSSQPVA